MAPGGVLIRALAAGFAFQTLGTLSQPLAMAAGETKLLFQRDFLYFLIRVPFIIIGVLAGGLAGIVYARILTGAITIVLHMQVVKRITGLALVTQLRANLRSMASIATMSVVVGLLSFRINGWGNKQHRLGG